MHGTTLNEQQFRRSYVDPNLDKFSGKFAVSRKETQVFFSSGEVAKSVFKP